MGLLWERCRGYRKAVNWCRSSRCTRTTPIPPLVLAILKILEQRQHERLKFRDGHTRAILYRSIFLSCAIIRGDELLVAAIINLRISDDLLAELCARAAEQGKTLDQIAEETIRAGLKERVWQDLLAYGQERGRASGIAEEQVPEVVKQWRRERRER